MLGRGGTIWYMYIVAITSVAPSSIIMTTRTRSSAF